MSFVAREGECWQHSAVDGAHSFAFQMTLLRDAIDQSIDATLRLDGFKKQLGSSEKAFATSVVGKMVEMGLVFAPEGRDKAVRTEWQVSVAPLGSIVIVGRQNRSESVFRLRVD